MSIRIEWVTENDSDRRALIAVVDALFRACGEDWVRDLMAEHPEAVRVHSPWRRQKERQAGHGFKGLPRRPVLTGGVRNPWLRILRIEVLEIDEAAILVFHKDTDGDSSRRDLLVEAVAHLDREIAHRVVVAIPHPETEAWGIWAAGHQSGIAEKGVALKSKLGVDPVAYPERLSSSEQSKRECKAVARQLGLESADAVVEALERAPIEHLERGVGCGLADFIEACARIPGMSQSGPI